MSSSNHPTEPIEPPRHTNFAPTAPPKGLWKGFIQAVVVGMAVGLVLDLVTPKAASQS